MKLPKRILYSAGAFIAIAGIGALTSPRVVAAVRAAYVEVVLPSQPVHFAGTFRTGDNPLALGPDTGRLGVTNVIVTNYNPAFAEVVIFRAGNVTTGCQSNGGPIVDEGGLVDVYVQGNSSLVIPYPTPLVVDAFNGHTCLSVKTTGNQAAHVEISGFLN